MNSLFLRGLRGCPALAYLALSAISIFMVSAYDSGPGAGRTRKYHQTHDRIPAVHSAYIMLFRL